MRRLLIIPLGALVLLVIAHTLLWRWAEGQLELGFAAWVTAQRAQGWTVTNARPIGGGWPLGAELTVPELFLAGGAPEIPVSTTWSADRVVLGIALLHPRTLSLSFEGMQRLRLADGPDIPYTADRLHASIPLEPGVPARSVDISATNLRAGLPEGGTATNGLTIALLQTHLDSRPAAAQGEPAVSFTGSAEDIGLPPPPPGRSWPLGSRIASVSVEGAVTGPVPRAADITTRATGWRDGGGTLEIKRLALGWGALGLSGSATLALDENMQLMGAATAHLVGQTETLDALVGNHAITANAAMAAKAVLSLIARKPEDGSAPEVDVPLTLQNRTLAMGRIPLTRLPELNWPPPP